LTREVTRTKTDRDRPVVDISGGTQLWQSSREEDCGRNDPGETQECVLWVPSSLFKAFKYNQQVNTLRTEVGLRSSASDGASIIMKSLSSHGHSRHQIFPAATFSLTPSDCILACFIT
jgi:hypothetical protein